jgi:bla regulator protein BlaR1
MIIYFLKSATCLSLLLAFYHLILEQEKMHHFNRFYLLGSVLFSFLAPLYIIYMDATPTLLETTPTTSEINLTDSAPIEIIQEKTIKYTQIFLSVYMLISFILLIRFGKNLLNILKKIKRNTKKTYQKSILVLIDDRILPHTFWNYIFINKSDYEHQKIEQELFTHELTHVTQKHTLDVLILEVIQIIFWINPLFILLKKAVQLNHEFLADERVINQHKNTIQYQHLLLNSAAWKNDYYLASNLNYSLTKKRLLMMTKQSSLTNILLKKLALIPLLAGFIFLFAERVEAKNTDSISDSVLKINAINLKQSKDTIPSDKVLKYKKLSATKSEIREYKSLLAKGKRNNIFKQKDVLKMQYLYKVMSDKQKKSVEDVFNIVPHQPSPANGKKMENNFKTTPPTPISTLDHLIRMAKKDATFYFETKEITSDKAIELLKKNKHLNIDTRNKDLKNPVVRISKKTIIIKGIDTDKKGEPTYYLNGKVISKKEMETLKTDNMKSVYVKKNKDSSGSIYITSKKTITIKGLDTAKKEKPNYYLDGKVISQKEIEKMSSDNIKSMDVKKNKDGSGSIYIKSKKTITIKGIDTAKKEIPTYYLDGKVISKKELEKMSSDNIQSMDVKKNKDGSRSIYITSKKE